MIGVRGVFGVLVVQLEPGIGSLVSILIIVLSVLASFLSLCAVLSVICTFNFSIRCRAVFGRGVCGCVCCAVLLRSVVMVMHNCVRGQSGGGGSGLCVAVPLVILNIV